MISWTAVCRNCKILNFQTLLKPSTVDHRDAFSSCDLKPQPSILNPQTSTPHLQPKTLNTSPSTFRPHPSTLTHFPSFHIIHILYLLSSLFQIVVFVFFCQLPLRSFYWENYTYKQGLQDFAKKGFRENFAQFKCEFRKNLWFYFREIQNNFVQISCWAKFWKCCFAATLVVNGSNSTINQFQAGRSLKHRKT